MDVRNVSYVWTAGRLWSRLTARRDKSEAIANHIRDTFDCRVRIVPTPKMWRIDVYSKGGDTTSRDVERSVNLFCYGRFQKGKDAMNQLNAFVSALVEDWHDDKAAICEEIVGLMESDPQKAVDRITEVVSTQLGYEEVVRVIRGLPDTYIPALMCECAKQGYRKPIFLPGGASQSLAYM